jgi:hypothetical protein
MNLCFQLKRKSLVSPKSSSVPKIWSPLKLDDKKSDKEIEVSKVIAPQLNLITKSEIILSITLGFKR